MAIQEMGCDMVTNACKELLQRPRLTPLQAVETLMDCPGVPMHDPIHHYIMPAALLTLAARQTGMSEDELVARLAIAEERARKVLPGFCGWWGSCGSAVGCGIFVCVWFETSPKKEEYWATANALTSQCLASISSVRGPRCCKRTSFLALTAVLTAAPELLGIDFGPVPKTVCSWNPFNKECLKEDCPFFSAEAAEKLCVRHPEIQVYQQM